MAVARLRGIRLAPRKARIIAKMIRGKDVTQAINELRFMNKAGSQEFFKLLVSAVANAEDKGEEAAELGEEELQHAEVEQHGAQAAEEDGHWQHAERPHRVGGVAKDKGGSVMRVSQQARRLAASPPNGG